MSDKIFLLGWICFAGFFGFLGILMLIGSSTSTRLLHKILGGTRFWESNSAMNANSRWQWRLAGLGIATLGIYFLSVTVTPFSVSFAHNPVPGEESVIVGKWVLLVVLTSIFLFGLCLVLRPRTIVSFTRIVRPNQMILDSATGFGFAALRFIGVCFMASAFCGVWLIFRK